MADWQALQIQIPGKDLLESVRGTLETLVVFMEVVKALLETVSLFLIDFGNPVRALVEALLNLIRQLFESLRRTGLYGYFDFPNPLEDPNFDRFRGGYQAFVERFKGSLFDSRDPFRPQPISGSTQSGFVLIVADAESAFGLLKLVNILKRFFGQELTSAQYVAPTNVKAFPIGAKDDPILRVADLFSKGIEGIAVEWTLATNQYPPDPGFSDLVATISSELIPQKWLIERTSRPEGPELISKEVTTNFESRDKKPVKRQERVRDETGDLFRKFQDYIVIDASTATATYLLGQLGTFRYLDKDIDKDKTYSYRIRAFSGSLDVSGTTLNLREPIIDGNTGEAIQKWPSSDENDPVVMGRPSPTVIARVPSTIPTDLDLIQCLENTFRMAFALGFHLELPKGSTFDEEGRNTGSTPVSAIGQGAMVNVAGPVQFDSRVVYGTPNGVTFSSNGSVTSVTSDPVTGNYPDVVHNFFVVKQYSAKLARSAAMALYESGEGLTSFRNLYKGSLPFPVGTKGFITSPTTLEDLVAQFNLLPSNFPGSYVPQVYETYNYAYNNAEIRLDLQRAVQFIGAFSLGGVSPDWVSISLLQDIVPWTGRFIYELLAKIDGLLDGFKSALDELKAFIDLVVRKIDSLERFIQFLIEILNYLDSFSAGFYFLSVPETDQGLPGWVEAIDTAGGTPPPAGAAGYSAGVGLAYAGTNVEAFVTAFGLIF